MTEETSPWLMNIKTGLASPLYTVDENKGKIWNSYYKHHIWMHYWEL